MSISNGMEGRITEGEAVLSRAIEVQVLLPLVGVDHFNGTTLFTVCPHCPLTTQTRRASNTEFRNLRAILTKVLVELK